MTRVLFVCHGNICRSPMAEFIFKAMVNEKGLENEFFTESAAVSAEEMGNPIYPPAKSCMNRHGVWFDPAKRSRKIVAQDYDRFDYIICMDSYNMRLIRHTIPGDPEGKIHLLMPFAGVSRDVADPWYTGDFEVTYRDLMVGCEALLEHICSEKGLLLH